MKISEAQALATTLADAFPRDWAFVGEGTNTVYVTKLAQLARYPAAAAAIDALIETERKLPTIAHIIAEYRQIAPRFDPPALPEPDLTDEERAENVRRIRALTQAVRGGSDDLADA